MSETLKTAVLRFVLRLLEPLVGFLLDNGIGVGELHQLSKRAYVHAARRRGSEAKPNVSRIAVLTGISRREVAEILAEPIESATLPDRGAHRAERVLQGWHQDPEFLDRQGTPLPLPMRGKKRSFAALVKRYAGDPRVRTLLDELVRAKAARRLTSGEIEVLSKTFNTARWDVEGVANIGERMVGLLDTLLHNLKHPTRPRYERLIINTQLDPKYLPLLIRDITHQADVMADSLQDALNAPGRSIKPARAAKPAHVLGLGLYLIEVPTQVDAEGASPRRSKS